jgi:hypothetical protein
MERPEVRYAPSGDLSIAYTQYGTGPDVVVVPGFVTHLDLFWDLPISKGIAERGEYARVLTFDKRGTGLSDRSVGLGSVEERMDDIRAVMDAAGVERAAMNGVSEGGPMDHVRRDVSGTGVLAHVVRDVCAPAGRRRLSRDLRGGRRRVRRLDRGSMGERRGHRHVHRQ